jgi:hypothetical protein
MHKLALKAVAKQTDIDIRDATKTKRHNPIMDQEIHIEEELINLQETQESYYTAGETLSEYPKIQSHMLNEHRTILQHCIGLTERMLHGRKLPYSYTTADVDHAVRRLVGLIVEDSRRKGQRIDGDVMDILKPFMSVRQRVRMGEWGTDMIRLRRIRA